MAMREPEEGKYDTRGSQNQPPLIQISCSSMSSHNSMKSASVGPCKPLPPSALRRGKFDVSADRAQPIDLSIIQDTFGENATLYDALCIQPSVDAAEIRRAYLHQGRVTLLNGGLAFTANDAPRDLDDVPELARKKFQSISIAYEILSTPGLRSDYDQYGLVYAQSPTPPAGADKPRRQNSVRWKPYVEEKLIIDSHPDEHSRTSESTDKPKRAPHKQEQEYGWLQFHLRNIDKEAEKFLVGDTLESFVDERFTSVKEYGVQNINCVRANFGSLIDNMGSRDSTQGDSEISAAGDSEVSAAVESKPTKNFMKKLRAKRNLFRKKTQITVESYQSQKDDIMDQDKSSVAHSPCSVTMFGQCMEDATVGAVGACGLSDTFYHLLGP
mmetsp:Transcript_21574/g.46931  ORF Transcript_21574/g.46931 Transcript_21574/m.46931 type:complete len:384 (+) Transcript_21574:187-1338(+)